MNPLNTNDVRKLDLIAQDAFSIPGILLMEHASLGLAEVLLSLSKTQKEKFLFLCGRGNNGGDGLAAARHLHNNRLRVEIVFTGRVDQIRPGSDAETNARIAIKMGIPIFEAESADHALERIDAVSPTRLVDAVFGTGLSSDVRGWYGELFDGINSREYDVTAVDVPSGLDSDSGLPLGTAIKAQRTVTFAFPKKGLLNKEGQRYCGEVIVKGIGLPLEVIENPGAYL